MKVRVLYFSLLRKATDCDQETIELSNGADLTELLRLLVERHPQLKPHLPSLMLTRNQEWTGRREKLDEGDEVGLMPPVSGG